MPLADKIKAFGLKSMVDSERAFLGTIRNKIDRLAKVVKMHDAALVSKNLTFGTPEEDFELNANQSEKIRESILIIFRDEAKELKADIDRAIQEEKERR